MNQNVLLKALFFSSCLLTLLFFNPKAYSQSCNDWLRTSTVGSFVSIGDLDISGNKLTVEAIFNRVSAFDNTINFGKLVSKHTDASNVNYSLMPSQCEITTNVTGYVATPFVCPPEFDKTYHVAMVYDGATLKFYRDGYVISQVACTGNLINNNLLTTIGQLAGAVQPADMQHWGYIDEVRIWKAARTQAELKAFMHTSLPNPASQNGLVAYYTFDDLLNKQGNPAWNGTLNGNAVINQTNPNCGFAPLNCSALSEVVADFTIPDTVCVNTPVNISNISLNATSSYWNFCVADPNKAPTAVNLGNPGGSLSLPVFTDIVYDNGNYYVFLVNYYPGGLVRLDFGNSLLNTPTSVNFGNFGNIIPDLSEGIQVVKNDNKWYAIIVGGNPTTDGSRIVKVDFGANISNPSPVATNWGNIGDLYHPMELHLFKEGNNWFGLTVNSENSTITRLSFGNSFDNIPTGVNLGNIGGLDHPGGINVINDNGYWRAFTTNATSNSITRLDFGTSMTNTPTGINLGNPGGALKDPRDLYIMKECGETIAFVINGQPDAGFLKLDFNNDFSSIPAIVNFGNLGNMNFPHSISQLFRAGNDLYCFVPNAANNTITRVRFAGCTNSSIPNSSLQNPSPITYTTPGTYNISLTIDEGLPTQSSVCKQIVVKDCTIPIVPDFDIPDTVCVNIPVNISNTTTGAASHYWNFCVADINQTPIATNLGNLGGQLSMPVFMDLAQDDNGDYYGFSINHIPGQLIRYKFGNSYLNTPVIENLGNYNDKIPNQAEGVQVVKSNGKWYIVIVGGGNNVSNSSPRIVTINFGTSLGSITQTANNWGNIGTLSQPIDLHVFNEADHWYGFTVNATNNTITRFDFSNNLDNAPTATNLGNFGLLNYPDGIYAINDNGFWRVFVTNGVGNTLIRLDFGNSLLNIPVAVNLGNPGNILITPRDMLAVKFCGSNAGFIVNATTDEIIKLDFGSGFDQQPTAVSLGNIANLDKPHSLSKLFRVDQDIYSFITNVDNNTITRIKFSGCNNSSIPNSSLQNPPPITYSLPGTYNISLTVDDGLPTQASVCKQVVVKDCEIVVGPLPTSGCGGFQFALGGNAYDRAYDVAATTNNDFYVAGVSKSFSSSDDILVSRLTAAGSVIWSKTFGNNNTELLRKITPTADGGLLIVGQTKSFSNSRGDILSMKINSTGALVWSKILGVGSANGDLGMDIIETSDGGYAVSGILNVEGTVADAVVIKLDNAANVIWSKRFDRGDGDNGVGLFQKGDTLIVSIDLQNTIYNYETLLMKLKLVDGTFIMAKKLTPATRGLYNPYIHKDPLQPGYIVSLHTIDNSSYTKMNHTILNLDEDFNIRKSRLISIDPPTNDFYTGLAVLPDGSFIGTSTNQTNGDGCIYRINDDNSGVFVKKFNAAAARRLYRVAVSGQQLMAVGGAIDNGQEDFFITSFDITGALGAVCDVEDIALKIQQPVFTVSPFTWPTISDVSFPASSAILNTVNAPLQNKDLCPVSRPDFSIKRDPCSPKTMQIETNLTNIQNYEWDFGDGQTNIGNPNPVVTYTDFGTYIIKLKTQNIAGCIDSIEKQIFVDVTHDNLILTNDTTICYGSTKQLLTTNSLNFCWSPTTYLDNPGSPNPVTSATQDITYYFTAEVTGANLITNGNFSQGNTGFTSAYNFAASNTTEGQYFVGANPKSWNNSLSACKDHTTGNGNMMLVNGSPTADMNVWKQTVNVTPNTNYAFSTWIQALYPPNPAQLQFSINGKDAGSLITASLPTCSWTQFYTTWNSGNNTTAVISIVNKNTLVQGNDFALDDISFAPVFIKRDSVKVKVEKPLVQANNDTSFCPGSFVQLNTTGAQNYSWSPATGLSNTGIADPVASPVVSTEYIVTGTTVNGCSAKDTVHVNIYAKPAIAVSDDTLICKNALAQLSVTGGVSYSWSPAATLNDPLAANPIASPLVNTKYYVAITDANTCEHLDSVQVSIRPDAVFSINNPGPICRLDSAQLAASGGDVYSWQPAEGLNNAGIFNPKVSPSATTGYKVTITEATCNHSETLSTTVTVNSLPTVIAGKSNDIDCRNDRSQLNATGADQYLWSPAATLDNPGIANPIAIPASATQYIVTGTNLNGCSAKDTINVNVITKPAIVISNDTTICKNAPIQLFVSGGINYRWSPAATLNNNLIANPIASPDAGTMYYVTITDASTCEWLDSVKVNVRPDAVFSVNAPGKVCLFDSAQLKASGGNIYAWQPAEGLDNTGTANPWVSPSVTTEYKVTITETTCNQSATLSTRLTVMPLPTVNAMKANDIDCSNDRSQLNVTGAAQYAWTPATTLNNPGIANPMATPTTTTTYVVKGTDLEGCKGYDTITVKVDNVNKGGYLMPNAFTPNNDGLNDCFGVKYWGVIEKFEFSIYNRWGNRIFTTKNPGQCWDGSYKGVEQDGGVYVYMIKAKTTCEAEVFRKGTFVLIR